MKCIHFPSFQVHPFTSYLSNRLWCKYGSTLKTLTVSLFNKYRQFSPPAACIRSRCVHPYQQCTANQYLINVVWKYLDHAPDDAGQKHTEFMDAGRITNSSLLKLIQFLHTAYEGMRPISLIYSMFIIWHSMTSLVLRQSSSHVVTYYNCCISCISEFDF